MKLFKDLEEGEVFVVAGGFELQKCVEMLENSNAVLMGPGTNISVLIDPYAETWEPDEFWEIHKEHPREDVLFTA